MSADWAGDALRLQSVLQTRNPARAAGGRNALSGLSFQAHLAILEFLRLRVDGQRPHGSGVLVENVSDYAAVHDDGTIVTCQVKRTLRSAALTDALNELLDVHRAAVEELPELASRLRYRVACRRIAVADPDRAVAAWAAGRAELALARAVADAVEVTEQRDPLAEILAILANQFQVERPARMVARWVRRILDEADERLRADLLAELMDEDLADDDEEQLPFVVLSAADREPDSVDVAEQGFLVGEQPRLSHLREGYFAPNPRLSAIEDDLWEWHESLATDQAVVHAGRIPVYWIEGPSGSGKSIALMQFLARLNGRGDVTVLWVESRHTALPAAFRYARALRGERRVVIGLDDPFMSDVGDTPGVWSDAMAQAAKDVNDGNFDALPLLVFCSPPEQRRRFLGIADADVVVRAHRYLPPSEDDVVRLRDWYRRRTGDVRELPVAEPNLLPAQLFFEWWQRVGIRQFAQRFHRRLAGFPHPGLKDLMYRVLALNRIYLGYPVPAMDRKPDVVRDIVAELERDLHIARNGTGRKGYWLSHPHLADIVYETWFSSTVKTHERAGHLESALVDALRADDDGAAHAPLLGELCAVLHVGLDVGPRSVAEARVTREAAERAVRRAADEVRDRRDRLGPFALAAWVHVQSIAPSVVSWEPGEVAIAHLRLVTMATPPLQPLLLAMIQYGDRRMNEAVLACLDDHRSWPRWAFVMDLLIARGRVPVPATHIADGVRARATDHKRVDLLVAALAAAPGDQVLATTALNLLAADRDGNSALGRLAGHLAGAGRHDAVLDWLRAVPGRAAGGAAVATMLRLPTTPIEIYDLAPKWLARNVMDQHAAAVAVPLINWQRLRDPPFQHVLGRYLQSVTATAGADVIDTIAGVLAEPAHQDTSSWTYVLGILPRWAFARSSLRRITLSWLQAQRETGGWPVVWNVATEALRTRDPELADIGREHLTRCEEPEHWPVVVRGLLRACPPEERTALVDRACPWLDAHPGSTAGWGYLATALFPVASPAQRETLVAIALRWLGGNEDERHWSYVWRATMREATDPQDVATLIERAVGWMGVPERQGWSYVLRDLLPRAGQVACDLAGQWLPAHLDDSNWPTVLGLVGGQLPRSEVAALLASWLDEGPVLDSAVGYVWRVLVEDCDDVALPTDPGLRGALLRWLRREPQARTWWHIWSTLHEHDPLDREVIAAGTTLTAPTRAVLQRAHGVANRLSRSAEADPRVTEAVSQVLSEGDLTATAWLPTWQRFGLEHDDPAYFENGLRWLAEVAEADWTVFVWTSMWDARPDRRDELRAIGTDWCTANTDGDHWASMWRRLAEGAGGDPRLREAARAWLADPSSSRDKHRQLVVQRLAELDCPASVGAD